ncbi:hypothetical protein V2J09_020179 [Rumex salicifolius]
MRRASSKLLSLSNAPKPSSQFLRCLTNSVSPTPIIDDTQTLTPSSSKNPKFKPCGKSNSLIFSTPRTHHFCEVLSRSFSTQVENAVQLNSRQRRIKEKSELEEAFESAESAEEMIKAFKEMESRFEEGELGLACLKVGLKLDQEGGDPEKVLSFANRALAIMAGDNKVSLPVAMTLQLLGSVNYTLKRFNDSLGFLNSANKILNKLEEDGSCDIEDIRPVLHAVQLELANTKNAMGRREDALGNLKKCLEIKELALGKDSKDMGNANRDLAESYVAILNFNEALPYCMKALEIHKVSLGQNSVEVAHDRRLLGVIYSGLEEHEKALEQNQLSQKVLKNWGLTTDLLRAEIDAANMQIALGKFDSAVNTLKNVVNQTEKDSENRALVFISMAKALVSQEKFPDAKRCLEIATDVLGNKELVKPVDVAEAYMEISMQYESMNEFETAISILKRALALLERIPQEQHSEGSVSARIGWLLLLTGKVSEAIPYLESAAETLKESFGPKHFGIGYIYNNLGAAYLELDRPQSAAQMFAVAKEIMDVALGPHHTESIEACQNLSKAYTAMGSFGLAIEFQERAVNAWKGHGPSAEDELREARRLLEQLKLKSSGNSIDKFSTKALPLPQTSNPRRSIHPEPSNGVEMSKAVQIP